MRLKTRFYILKGDLLRIFSRRWWAYVRFCRERGTKPSFKNYKNRKKSMRDKKYGNRAGKRNISERKRLEVLERDNYECQVRLKCEGLRLQNHDPSKEDYATIDHKEAVAFGGGKGMGNLQSACKACNLEKSKIEGKLRFRGLYKSVV